MQCKPVGRAEVGDTPFLAGFEALTARIGSASGGRLDGLLGMAEAVSRILLAPFAYLVALTSGISAVLAFGVESLFPIATRLSVAVGRPSPVLVSCMLLLLTARLALYPLTRRTARKAATLAAVKPALASLQAKYGDDREILSQRMMQVYKSTGANPLSACLPMLLLIPLYMAIWGLVAGLTTRDSTGTLSPDYTHPESDLMSHLSGVESIEAWQMDLALALPQVGWCAATTPYLVVLGLFIAVTYAQSASFAALGAGRRGARIGVVVFFSSSMILLPMFVVLLRLVDAVFVWGQSLAMQRYREKYKSELLANPDFLDLISGAAGDLAADLGRGNVRDLEPPDPTALDSRGG